MAGCEPGRGTSPDTESSKALILDFLGSRTLRNKLWFFIRPSICRFYCVCVCMCVVCVSSPSCLTLPPYGLEPARLICPEFPRNSPGKNAGVGCHSLLQGIFSTQGSNLGFLHCRQILYHLRDQGSPTRTYFITKVPLLYILQ